MHDVGIRTCAKCRCTFPLDYFYLKGGRPDSYCRGCRKQIAAAHNAGERVAMHHRGAHAFPTATKKCRTCGVTMAPFKLFWPGNGDECTFCRDSDERTS